jgi:hypothetical protein
VKLFTTTTSVTDGISVQKIKQESKVSLGALSTGGCEGDSVVTEEASLYSYNNDRIRVLSSR